MYEITAKPRESMGKHPISRNKCVWVKPKAKSKKIRTLLSIVPRDTPPILLPSQCTAGRPGCPTHSEGSIPIAVRSGGGGTATDRR